jgi:hypothetical protein
LFYFVWQQIQDQYSSLRLYSVWQWGLQWDLVAILLNADAEVRGGSKQTPLVVWGVTVCNGYN